MVEVTLYRFRVRDPINGKWRTTRHHMTLDEARTRHGEANYELLEWSREVRRFDLDKLSAGHMARPALVSALNNNSAEGGLLE